jgi:hypothetical protein
MLSSSCCNIASSASIRLTDFSAKELDRELISDMVFQLSVISYQLSVVSYQLPVISYQLPVISYQGLLMKSKVLMRMDSNSYATW